MKYTYIFLKEKMVNEEVNFKNKSIYNHTIKIQSEADL